MVLQKDKALAEMIETYDARAINIRISGENRRDLLAIIMDNFDQINAQYEKMKVEKYIPCQCQVCKKVEANLSETACCGLVYCDVSFEMLDVQKLLDQVIVEQPHSKKDKYSPIELDQEPTDKPVGTTKV
jgi:internalin A